MPPQATRNGSRIHTVLPWHPQKGFTLSNEAKLSVHQRQLWITLTQLRSTSPKDQLMTRNLTACQTKINTLWKGMRQNNINTYPASKKGNGQAYWSEDRNHKAF